VLILRTLVEMLKYAQMGQAPADKAESGEQTLQPLLGEPHVTGRKLDCSRELARTGSPIDDLTGVRGLLPVACATRLQLWLDRRLRCLQGLKQISPLQLLAIPR
jgi:hypothetical protein